MDSRDRQFQRTGRPSPYGYRKLLSEKLFLKVKRRAQQLSGTDLISISYKDNRLMFKTLSGTDHKTIWTQIVEIQDLTPEMIREFDFRKLSEYIRESKLKVWCSCPAFLYWGFQYISWRKGYGLVKETRPPRVRNPRQQGAVCKHLYQVMQVFPFWANALAKKYKINVKDNSDQDISN